MAPIYIRSKVTSKDYAQGYYYRGYNYWLLPIGSGTATVKEYYSMKDYTVNTYEKTYIYTVEKGVPTMSFYSGEPYYRDGKWNYSPYKSGFVYIGNAFEAPQAAVTIKNKLQIIPGYWDKSNVIFETADIATDYHKILHILDSISSDYSVETHLNFTESLVTTGITYESSDPTIATVDTITGAVTPLKAGEVTITAKWAGNDSWKAAETSYTLTIEKKYASVYFSPSSLTITEGDTFTEPEATTEPAGLPLTYSSSNEAVATVDATTGKLTIHGTGDATITATFAGNDEYREASRSYTLIVNERPKADPELSFSDSWLYYYIGYENTLPTLNNPANLPVTYTSDNTDVAQVDATTGAITPVAMGNALITATFVGDNTYNAKSDWYRIYVTSALQWALEPVITFDDVTGDGSHSVTFDPKTNTITLTNAVYDMAGNCKPDDPDCKGSVKGGFIFERWEDDLNVVLVGTNEFTNHYGLFQGGKTITFSGEGSLRMAGTMQPIGVSICTIDGASLIIEGDGGTEACPSALYFDTLTIINNGHLLAKTHSDATWCSE
ncbi:MAG: Ig-like domain-containing protein, partial [Paludibacteraceae bacterium]|nr:Ig-like domain-containing protein [Paludibacteraceae bacterium]